MTHGLVARVRCSARSSRVHRSPVSDGRRALLRTVSLLAVLVCGLAVAAAAQPLSIVIDSPAGGLVTSQDTVEVSGIVDGMVELVTVNGVEATLSGGGGGGDDDDSDSDSDDDSDSDGGGGGPITFTVTVPLAEGTNRLVATATNLAGESATDSVSVRRDTAPPLVVIETPRDGDRLVSETITIAGTVNDIIPGATVNEDDVTVTVNGLPAAVNNRSFILADLPLALDENTITATAVDRAGNTGSTSIVVTREPDLAGIRIVISQGNTQIGPINSLLPIPLGVQVLNEFGLPIAGRPVEFGVSRGDGLLGNPADNVRTTTLLTDGNGAAAFPFTLGSRTGEGFHRVLVTTPGSLTFAEFCATAEPLAPINIAVARPVPAAAVAGQPVADALAVIVTDVGGNSVPGVDVTFEVLAGDGTFGGGSTAVVVTDPDGIALAEWTLGPVPGRANNLASATFAGNPGLPASFIISGVETGPVGDTSVSGLVQSSTGTALEGARAVIRGTALEAFTGPDGSFTISGVSPGGVRVGVLGSAANDPAMGLFYPDIDFAIEAVSGADNELDQIVVLPFLDSAGAKLVGGDEDIVLEMQGVPGFGVKVFANSVVLPNGTRGEIVMSSSQVKFDKVPMPPPQGSTPLVVGTLQPSGIRFDPPAQVIYPNAEGLAPGDVADIFAFHHDIGQFVNVGPGTVSEDGSVVVSDPGFGIVESGWHCLIRLPGPGAECENSCTATVTNDGVEITDSKPLVLVMGADATVQVTFTPAGTLEGSWTSADAGIASVAGGATPTATVTGVAMGTTTVTTPTSRSPSPDPDQGDITCEAEFPATVVKLELVTPDGDPVTAPVGSGDGQNEFTYSIGSPGELTIDFKAKITPSSAEALAAIKDKVKFTVEDIAGSTKTWDAANPDGMATVSGDFLVASVTFSGLPASNAAFGAKQTTVEFDGTEQDSVTIEVFFPRDATNNAGGVAENWYFYWNQTGAGDPDLLFSNDPVTRAGIGQTPAIRLWSTFAGPRDEIRISDAVRTALGFIARNSKSGIDGFANIRIHENRHVQQVTENNTLSFYTGVTGVLRQAAAAGWAFNVGVTSALYNHFDPGPDNLPGVAAVDDDADGTTDEADEFLLGVGGDVDLDLDRDGLGTGFDGPGVTIETQAAAAETIPQDQFRTSDWADPGKQHGPDGGSAIGEVNRFDN